jgi:hypothetical protein
MKYELEAMERQGMLAQIEELKQRLSDIEADWKECARTGKSPCFYCANDDTCNCSNTEDCCFKWQTHN